MCNLVALENFNIGHLSWRLDGECLENFLDNALILAPLVCIEDNGELFIVDGLKRYFFAKSKGIQELSYVIIDPPLSIISIIKSLQSSQLAQSVIHRLRFIRYFDLGFDEAQFKSFNLPFYSHIKKDVDRILALSTDAQRFLHHKGFSFKEIINLLHHSTEAFLTLLSDDDLFQFSKRTFDEALSFVSALTKRHNMSVFELFKQTHYDDLKLKDLTPQQRQKVWLKTLSEHAHPVLFLNQKKIDALISEVMIPAQLTYDRSLEHSGINIQSKIKTSHELSMFLDALSKEDTLKKIQEVIALT